jgi:Resolvase, N terminal domain
VTVLAKTKGKRVALYLRVSTSEQTTHNQRRELLAVAARHKWDVVEVFEDAGISGAKGRDQRPGLDAMMTSGAFAMTTSRTPRSPGRPK